MDYEQAMAEKSCQSCLRGEERSCNKKWKIHTCLLLETKSPRKLRERVTIKSYSCKMKFLQTSLVLCLGWEAYLRVIETCLLKIVKEVQEGAQETRAG